MRRARFRVMTAVAAAAGLMIAGAHAASADDLRDTITGNQSVTLVAGGASGSAGIFIQQQGSDGDQGCNLDGGGEQLKIAVDTPAGVTASPSELTFVNCTDTKTVTLTAATGASSGAATARILSNNSGGTFDNQVNIPITVTANTPPTLSLPSNITAEATGPGGAAVSYTATANDAQDGALTPTCTPASGSTFALGQTTVNCSVTDSGHLSANGSFTVTTRDTTRPTLTLPANRTVEATGASGAVVSFAATASDLVSGSRPVTCTPPSGSTFALGTTTVTCSASDAAGNTASGSFTVTVVDTTGPVLTLPADITTPATGATGAVVTYTANASDAVRGPASVSCTPASGSTFPLGSTTVTCTATDGTTPSSGSFRVTVVDRTAPVVEAPGDVIAEATGAGGAAVTFTATANDLQDGALTPTCSPSSGSTFALGSTTVTCSATDKAGNIGRDTFTVTVVDTTAPHLTLPDDFSREATGASGAVVTFAATATDLVDGAVPVECTPASGSTFALDTTTVNCEATDTAGNKAQGSFDVTVADSTAPDLTLPSDITNEATGSNGAKVSYAATATDTVDGSVPVSCDTASGEIFPLGTTTVTCTATDEAGNTATGTFDVTVVDTTAPALSLPSDITEEATGASGAAVSYTASASDIVDGSVPVTCIPASDSTFPLGVTTVNCSATDENDNTAEGSFTVTVQDTTPPVLDLPDDITAEATGASGAVVSYTAGSTDAVDGDLPVTCTPESDTTFAIGGTTVSCSATDRAENTAYGSFTVTVADTTAPVLALPDDATAEATGPSGTAVTYTASASDLVDGPVTVTCSPASGSTFAIGKTTVNCSATDTAGNEATGSFTVIVVDTTAPALALPTPITSEATGSSGAMATYSATANDLVDGPLPLTCTPASGSTFRLGATTVNCSATDTAGNKASGSFTVTVVDTTAPALSLPSPITREATGPSGAVVTYTAGASDIVDGPVSVTCTPASGSTFALGATTVNCSATDAARNTARGSFTVTVRDTTAPTIRFVGGPTDGGRYVFGFVPVAPTCTASDAVTATVSCTVTGYSSAVGPHTLTATATDGAGNRATKTLGFTVASWTLKGFYAPIDLGGVYNTVKGGSTVPVKFELFAGTTELSSVGDVVSITAQGMTCSTRAVTDAIETTVATGGTALRYDTTAGQYIFNWKTPTGAGKCYQLAMTARDGSVQTALFQMK